MASNRVRPDEMIALNKVIRLLYRLHVRGIRFRMGDIGYELRLVRAWPIAKK